MVDDGRWDFSDLRFFRSEIFPIQLFLSNFFPIRDFLNFINFINFSDFDFLNFLNFIKFFDFDFLNFLNFIKFFDFDFLNFLKNFLTFLSFSVFVIFRKFPDFSRFFRSEIFGISRKFLGDFSEIFQIWEIFLAEIFRRFFGNFSDLGDFPGRDFSRRQVTCGAINRCIIRWSLKFIFRRFFGNFRIFGQIGGVWKYLQPLISLFGFRGLFWPKTGYKTHRIGLFLGFFVIPPGEKLSGRKKSPFSGAKVRFSTMPCSLNFNESRWQRFSIFFGSF